MEPRRIELRPGETVIFYDAAGIEIARFLPKPEPTPEPERCYGCGLPLRADTKPLECWSQQLLRLVPVCQVCFNSTEDGFSRIDSYKRGWKDGLVQGLAEGQERPVERP